jgi:hypothetical protein
MEAVPLSSIFAADCARALVFHLITRFVVPDTITSDRGNFLQIFRLTTVCDMLNISHRQTTAYHPEVNDAVKRLHRRLEGALCVLTTLATWAEEIPFPAEGRHWSFPAEAVFGTPFVLPNEFLQAEEFPVDQISKNFPQS